MKGRVSASQAFMEHMDLANALAFFSGTDKVKQRAKSALGSGKRKQYVLLSLESQMPKASLSLTVELALASFLGYRSHSLKPSVGL